MEKLLNEILDRYICYYENGCSIRTLHRIARESMQSLCRRKLITNEYVHHKDQNVANNEYANLLVVDPAEHKEIHKILKLWALVGQYTTNKN